MIGLANPNPPCCSSCGDEGPEESFQLYRFELICGTCFQDHEAKRHAEGCANCGAKDSTLTETAGGDLLCLACLEADSEMRAERQEEAAAQDYFGGECAPEVYERASQRSFARSMR
jgi:hypothetical protein